MKADRAVITAGNALLVNKYLPSSLAVLILPLMLFVSLRHNLACCSSHDTTSEISAT
jgi:hypothetical protein